MKTEIFNGILKFADDKNSYARSSMKLYKLDDYSAVGEDGLIYQILPYDEVLNSDGEITAELLCPIIIYADEEKKAVLNYAESGDIKLCIKCYVISVLDDMKYEILNSKFSNEALLNILISINENKTECNTTILDEYLFILEDAIDKFKYGKIIEFHEDGYTWLHECKYIDNIETLKGCLEENGFPYYENKDGLYAIYDDADEADRLASEENDLMEG